MYGGKPNMDSENKAVHVSRRKPYTLKELGWIMTFHAGDNREMSALHCSALAALVYIVAEL